jgi:hypothetical protein
MTSLPLDDTTSIKTGHQNRSTVRASEITGNERQGRVRFTRSDSTTGRADVARICIGAERAKCGRVTA